MVRELDTEQKHVLAVLAIHLVTVINH